MLLRYPTFFFMSVHHHALLCVAKKKVWRGDSPRSRLFLMRSIMHTLVHTQLQHFASHGAHAFIFQKTFPTLSSRQGASNCKRCLLRVMLQKLLHCRRAQACKSAPKAYGLIQVFPALWQCGRLQDLHP